MLTACIPCCIPFCTRTFERKFDGEYETMCWPHWRAIPLKRRQAYARAYRWIWKGEPYRRKDPPLIRRDRPRNDVEAAMDRLWARCKRAATEAALEIG